MARDSADYRIYDLCVITLDSDAADLIAAIAGPVGGLEPVEDSCTTSCSIFATSTSPIALEPASHPCRYAEALYWIEE